MDPGAEGHQPHPVDQQISSVGTGDGLERKVG